MALDNLTFDRPVKKLCFVYTLCTYQTNIQQECQRLWEDIVSFEEHGDLH